MKMKLTELLLSGFMFSLTLASAVGDIVPPPADVTAVTPAYREKIEKELKQWEKELSALKAKAGSRSHLLHDFSEFDEDLREVRGDLEKMKAMSEPASLLHAKDKMRVRLEELKGKLRALSAKVQR